MNELSVKFVAITGTLNKTRDEIASDLENMGAVFMDRVTHDTDILIVGDKPGKTKVLAAAKYAVDILPKETWLKIWEDFSGENIKAPMDKPETIKPSVMPDTYGAW